MPITEFKELWINTKNLDARLSTLLGRYTIINNPLFGANADTSPKAHVPNCFEVLIARIQQVIHCHTKRITAREVFRKLVDEFNKYPPTNEEQTKQKTLILLGALLHRYFRIIQEYKNINKFSFWGLFHPFDCNLFQSIRSVLKLESQSRDKYEQEDLSQLDVVTVVTSLEAFRNYMLFKVAHKKPHYESYPHFAGNANFVTYLQNIIDSHLSRDKLENPGLTILDQFKAVRFVQSLAEQMECDRQLLIKSLDEWSIKLKQDYPDFLQLNSQLIEEHINQHTHPAVRNKAINLLGTRLIQEELTKYNHATFLEAMKCCHYTKITYILLGGYALLLQIPGINKSLKHCIYQALGCCDEFTEPSTKTLLVWLKMLKEYIDIEPPINLDCHYFGNFGKMYTQVLRAGRKPYSSKDNFSHP